MSDKVRMLSCIEAELTCLLVEKQNASMSVKLPSFLKLWYAGDFSKCPILPEISEDKTSS